MTSWQGGRPLFTCGGNFPISASLGRSASLPRRPSGTLSSSISAIRSPIASRFSTPSARHIRRIEPYRLIATGCELRLPSSSTTCSNSRAGPPPGLFMQRSAISAISSRARTGCETRTSSPMASMAAMNCRRLSRDMVSRERAPLPSPFPLPRSPSYPHVHCAHPAHEELVRHIAEAVARHALGERRRRGERLGGLW